MLDFTNTEVKTYELLPTGDYKLACTAAEIKSTKTGDGKYIKATFTVADGEHKSRKIFHNFNIENKNPKAVEIAHQELKKFMLAAGVSSGQMRFKSGEELCLFMLNKTGTAQVGIEKNDRGDQNRIKTWKFKVEDKKPTENAPF